MSQRKIAKSVGVSLGSMSTFPHKKEKHKMLKYKEKEGVEGKKNIKRGDLTLLHKSKINQQKTSEELKRDLDESGVRVSSSTI